MSGERFWVRKGEVVMDERRRVALGRLVESVEPGQRYEASEACDGEIRLRRVV